MSDKYVGIYIPTPQHLAWVKSLPFDPRTYLYCDRQTGMEYKVYWNTDGTPSIVAFDFPLDN